MKRSREPEEYLPPPHHSPSPVSATIIVGTDRNDSSSGPASPYEPDGSEREPEPEHKHEHAGADTDLPCAKIAILDPDENVGGAATQPAMACLLHPSKVAFPTYDAYESHYNREHLNRCIECRRNFPSPYYLGLHTDEWHDPFVAVKRDKGEHTYACFVEGCERKCGSSDKRRRHLIDKHSFPKNFFFGITQYGIDGRQSLLDDGWRRHRRRSSASITKKEVRRQRAASHDNDTKPEGTEGTETTLPPAQPIPQPPADGGVKQADATERPDVDMEDLAGAMSAMAFVPRSVKFGRGGKIGFARRS